MEAEKDASGVVLSSTVPNSLAIQCLSPIANSSLLISNSYLAKILK